jgi:hypothetical protein
MDAVMERLTLGDGDHMRIHPSPIAQLCSNLLHDFEAYVQDHRLDIHPAYRILGFTESDSYFVIHQK